MNVLLAGKTHLKKSEGEVWIENENSVVGFALANWICTVFL